MELKLDRARLADALTLLVPVTERKTTLPVSANILLRYDGHGSLELVATDLSVVLATRIEARGQGAFAVTLPGRAMTEIASSMLGDEVTLTLEGLQSHLASGKSHYQLAGRDAGEFPKMPETTIGPGSGEIDARLLQVIFDRASYCISQDPYRGALQGACLHIGDGTVSVRASDGLRMVVSRRPAQGERLPKVGGLTPEDRGASIPKKSVGDLMRLLEHTGQDPLQIDCRAGRSLQVIAGQTTLWLSLLEGVYPDFERFISKDPKLSVTAPRAALSALLHRISIATGKDGPVMYGARIRIENGTLSLHAETDGSRGDDAIEIARTGQEGLFETRCSHRLLKDALDHLSCDEVKLDFTAPLEPILIHPADTTDGDDLAVVMPMSL